MSNRKPYRVLIGQVRTHEGSKLAGAMALLNDKDGERLTSRHIVEPFDKDVLIADDLFVGAQYARQQDQEQRQPTEAEMIERLQLAGYSVKDPASLLQALTPGLQQDDPDASNGAGADEAKPALLDPEQRLAAIAGAVSLLDPVVESNWLKSGAPDVKALEGVLGYHITAAERDTAWEQHQAALADQLGNA